MIDMWNFAEQLNKYGPNSPNRQWSKNEAQSYCTWVTRTHYENFSAVSILLPRNLIPHFYPVYAYCRWSDDLADEVNQGEEVLILLDWWRKELLKIYAGGNCVLLHPVMVALKPTIEKFQIPQNPFLDLLKAFTQDQFKKRYLTFDELIQYCENSANPVGHLVLYLADSYNEENARRADLICTGLQLANFWQDIARDYHQLGRIYVPEEDWLRFGLTETDFAQGSATKEFREMLRFQVERTEQMFQEGASLLERLPSTIRLDIELILQGGLGILQQIRAVDYDVLTKRPKLSKRDQVSFLVKVLGKSLFRAMRGPFGLKPRIDLCYQAIGSKNPTIQIY